MSVSQGSSRNWDLLPSLQNAQGKELGGAAVARAGNTHSPACSRLYGMAGRVAAITEGTDGGLRL